MDKFNIYEISITPKCVKNRGLGGARAEALRRLDEMISKTQDAYEDITIIVGYRIINNHSKQ